VESECETRVVSEHKALRRAVITQRVRQISNVVFALNFHTIDLNDAIAHTQAR
jgi:hypothetical protein